MNDVISSIFLILMPQKVKFFKKLGIEEVLMVSGYKTSK
jgi:hypothetical protein